MTSAPSGLGPSPRGPPPRTYNPVGGSRADILRAWPHERRQNWLDSLLPSEVMALESEWSFWARAAQLPPQERFLCWLVLAGRGWGKTRTGAEFIINLVRYAVIGGGRVTLVGRTLNDAIKIMVEGESGILAHSAPEFMPRWVGGELTWPNGVKGLVFGATNPDAFRGYQHGAFWLDEICAWQHWSCINQLLLGCRLGKSPQGIITTTPRPVQELRDLIKKRTTITTTGSTYDNLANLSATFATEILAQYEGTRLGDQELRARILDHDPDALWQPHVIEANRVTSHPRLLRLVIGVDPAGSNNTKSNNTGIVAAGLGADKLYYVLEDGTLHGKPEAWAKQACAMYHRLKADKVIGEVNMGGDMVEAVIRAADKTVAYKGVYASRGKVTRAEPIALLYEQGRVKHVGFMPKLEDELTTYNPTGIEGMKSDSSSPDRLDALVWALTELHEGPQAHGKLNFANKSPARKNPYEGI